MAVDSSIIDNAIEFWNIIRDEKVVTVKFEKRSDGSTRIMKCTLDFTLIPKKDYPDKNINIAKILKLMQKSKIIHVYDLEKKGWRSVPFDNVEYLKTTDKTYKIKAD
jgi:hypothetical protein